MTKTVLRTFAMKAHGAGVDQDAHAMSCEMCRDAGGDILFGHPLLRVVLVKDAQYPGFCRVIWQEHVREMSDLSPEARMLFMQAVWAVEEAVRDVMQPHKMNLASLGNMTPHLHWHVIPRFEDDAHFPHPVWSLQQRTTMATVLAQRIALMPALREAIIARCETLPAGPDVVRSDDTAAHDTAPGGTGAGVDTA